MIAIIIKSALIERHHKEIKHFILTQHHINSHKRKSARSYQNSCWEITIS